MFAVNAILCMHVAAFDYAKKLRKYANKPAMQQRTADFCKHTPATITSPSSVKDIRRRILPVDLRLAKRACARVRGRHYEFVRRQ